MSEQFEPHAELPPEPMLSEAETRRLVERLEARIKETEQLERARDTRPQPSAEPVAWMYTDNTGEASLHGCRLDNAAKLGWTETPLYPASALEAARREALEQAASVVEGWRETDWPEGFCRFTAEEMSSDRAERIRALAYIKP